MAQADRSLASLKADNARLNLEETRAGHLILNSMPRFVMSELTQGCNLRCPMCRSRQIGYHERVLDRDVFAALADVLFPAAEIVDVRGWGESLLAPDIDGIIGLVNSYEARCRVVTNLSLNKPGTLDLLADTNAMIDISLDAADQETLDICRPGARLSLIARNAKRLSARLAEHGWPGESMRILATLQSVTLDRLDDLVRWAAEVGVRQVVLNEVTLAPGDPLAVVGIEDQVDAAVERARAVADTVGVELFAGSALGRCAGVRKEVPFCIHPWTHATVGYDGSVGYCDHLIGPMMPFSHMGQITTTAFADIWNGDAWQDLRRWHVHPERPDVPTYHACFRCYQHRNVDFEDVFEPRLSRYRLNLTPVRSDR
ncbi:MAG: radical SAM protein [Pseudonocardiaceae bacterium]